MFEIGKMYRITTRIEDTESWSHYTVLEYNPPLLKVQGGDGITIFNTSSPGFVSADLRPPARFDINLGDAEG